MRPRFILIFLLSALFLTGCDFIQDILDSKNGHITPETENVFFSAQGGEKTIVVESSCSWEVEYDYSSWFSLGGSFGNAGTSELVIYAFANEDASSRDAVITLKNEEKNLYVSINISQKGAAPTMGELRKELTVGSDGGEFLLELNTNMDYYARADQEWLYADPDYYGESLKVTVFEMPEDFTEKSRSATISIYDQNN
jgi:hypothetical protein